jgi:hypothetical protein
MRSTLLAAGALAALLVVPALAQTPPTNLRGKVESLDGQTLIVKSREGKDVHVTLAPNFAVLGVVKVKLAAIRPGDFVGIAALAGKDGKLHAQEVLVFPEAARGTGEGHYGWDLRGKDDTMTNATVAEVAGVSRGRVLKLKYKDGEQQIVVSSRTPIVTFAPDKLDLLKPGAAIFIRAPMNPDGSFTAPRAVVEKDGVKPPM